MDGFIRRLASVMFAVVLLTGFAPSPIYASPALAGPLPLNSCTGSVGVILAVDFGPWGGPVLRSCGSTPTTGYQLLNQGGWHSAGTQHDGPGLICRIGYTGFRGGTKYPTPEQDACVVTPPASAYWAYWHADAGQNTWKYSIQGPATYPPKPGSIDLWTYGATSVDGSQGKPKFSPNSLRNKAPSPKPSTARPPNPPVTVTTGPSPSASAAVSPSPEVTDSVQPVPSIVDAPEVTADVPGDTGSAWPTIVALSLVAVLAGVGFFMVRRRNRTGV